MALVLIVDDLAESRHFLSVLVRAAGHVARTAETGEEALREIRSAPIDVVLLDVCMPNMSGVQVLEELEHDPPAHRPRVIVMTASPDSDLEHRIVSELHADGFLSKSDLDFAWLSMVLNSETVAVDELPERASMLRQAV
ncbi:MAG: response regulator [Tepidisphaeraceae bacterium]